MASAGEKVFRIKGLRNHILGYASKNVSELTEDFKACTPPFRYINTQTGERRDYKWQCLANISKCLLPLLENYPSEGIFTVYGSKHEDKEVWKTSLVVPNWSKQHLLVIRSDFTQQVTLTWSWCQNHTSKYVDPANGKMIEMVHYDYHTERHKALEKVQEWLNEYVAQSLYATLAMEVSYPTSLRIKLHFDDSLKVIAHFPNNPYWNRFARHHFTKHGLYIKFDYL